MTSTPARRLLAAAALALALALALAPAASARRSVREYTINLDLAPGERFLPVINDASNGFNATVWKFYNEFFAHDKVLTDALYAIADLRGPEPEEMEQEVEGLAAASGLPLTFVKAVQMLYELQTLMVPIENFTLAERERSMPKGWEALARIPWRGPGCTGIIANNTADGTIYHARNLDFSPVPIMTNLVYTAIFTKGGQELFRSQMVGGYQSIVTAMKKGPNGFTIERNTRYPDHPKGNEIMLENLLKEKRPLNGWTLRKLAETSADYDTFMAGVAAAKYVSTEYAIISGVKKGVIFAKDPDNVAYTQTMGKTNYGEPNEYIIVTNFDWWWNDIRAYFDPTGGEIGHPRREVAQELLNGTLNAGQPLTGEVLFDVINHKGVLADTIFQGVFNVELGLWNVSQPDLKPKQYKLLH